jgi:hypothetical protein
MVMMVVDSCCGYIFRDSRHHRHRLRLLKLSLYRWPNRKNLDAAPPPVAVMLL